MRNFNCSKLIVSISIFFLCCLNKKGAAQPNIAQQTMLQNSILQPVEEYYIQNPEYKFHSSQKPYLYSTLGTIDDQAVPYRHYAVHVYNFRKEFRDSSHQILRASMQVLPQIDFQQSYDVLGTKSLTEFSGGIFTRINIKQKWSADAQLIGGYMSFPNFMDTLIRTNGVIPGLGMAYKESREKSGSLIYSRYAFANFSGTLSYSPKPYLNFQLAKAKLFIGDGYRSLLLSDVANNYPFFKINLNIWRLQYSCWYSWFYDAYHANNLKSKFTNKYGTFHYLSWNVTKKWNLSFFENIIWSGSDTNRLRGFDPNYLNPVIFFRPVEFSGGSSDNAMLGLNTSYNLFNKVKLYGQLVLDEFLLKEVRARKGWWANKQGFQVGLKYPNAFGIRKLSLTGEFNYVRPFTYTHGSSQQNYAHYNQPLAHPMGANFYEWAGILSYKHHRYRLELKGNYACIGKDTSWSSTSNVGQNIFSSYLTRNKEYNNFTTQGVKTVFAQAEIKYTFYLIPNINLRIEAGLIQRSLSNNFGFIYETPWLYAGIKTSLYNFYRDF